jgi:hypothetical protein
MIGDVICSKMSDVAIILYVCFQKAAGTSWIIAMQKMHRTGENM